MSQKATTSTGGESHGEYALAVDIGGTRFRVGLVRPDGQVVFRASQATAPARGPDVVLQDVVAALRDVQTHLGPGEFVRGVGVGAPGPLDPWEGLLFSAPNMPGWKNVRIKTVLERALGLHVVVGNDANLAALGEARFGAGRGHSNLVYLTVSTGIGSGILVRGSLLLGVRGLASEAGHMTVDLNGPRCNCGNRGCLEVMASGTAIARRAGELLDQGEPSVLAAQRDGLAAEMVEAAAIQGDTLASRVVMQAATALGFGIVGLVHLFNPTIVILGGGVSRSGDLWWDTVRSTVEQNAMPEFRAKLRLVSAELGDDVGLLGAVAAVFDEPAVTGRV